MTLFADLAYVYKVDSYFTTINNVEYNRYLYEDISSSSYASKVMNEACDVESKGYICLRQVDYTQTLFEHEERVGNYMRIYVYFPYSATNSVSIRTRSFYQLFNGYNGTTIKDYNTDYSSLERGRYTYPDGSKIVLYLVPDSSSYYKEITVTTCLDGQLPTDQGSVCGFAVLDVMASDDYGVELR